MASLERAQASLWRRPRSGTGFWSWIATVDHKRIGVLYGVTAFAFFLIGGIEAWLVRIQLVKPNFDFLIGDQFNAMVTMHATTMVFMAIMPLSAAFMNYFLPLMIGARDVAFPRLNAFSYWAYLFGAMFLTSSFFLGGAPNAGWFAYAPLTSVLHNPGVGMDFWLLGLQFLGLGTLVSGFNFIVTIINMRAPGMSLMRMPVFVWTTLVTSFLIIFSFPAITVALFMLMFDRFFRANFFVVGAGADVVLWQHLFWVFGHPEVYILILPAMGIVSEILPTFARKPIFGYAAMVFAAAVIGFLGFSVWSHHMFAVGQGPVVNAIFAVTTMTIAVPTGVKIFNWLATLWGGALRLTTAMMFAVAFILTFTIGGVSGVMHAAAPSDLQQTDTYFIVAHIHYVLVGGALTALFGGIYYWFPKVFGRLLNEKLGQLHFWLLLIGINVTFFPFHFLGMDGMPRRIYTYDTGMGWETSNLVSTAGVFVIAAAVTVFMLNVALSLRAGARAGKDPWDGRTLEWAVSSPPPVFNFAVVPEIESRDPVWAAKHPEPGMSQNPDTLYGRLGGLRGGARGIHMPLPSFTPVLLALGLVVLCYGAVYRSVPVAAMGGLWSVLSVYVWAFEGPGEYLIEPEGDR